MTHRNPPRLATWLLDSVSACDEALVGDMIEEYRSGRSRLWYWRQTFVAVLRATLSDVRSHPVLVLKASLLMAVSVLCYDSLLHGLQLFCDDVMWKLSPVVFYPERITRLKFMINTALNVVAPAAGYAVGARVVSRFHRGHQTTFTLVNTLLVCVVGALQLLWLVEHDPSRVRPWFPYYVYYREGILALFIISTLLGGLWKQKSTRKLA